MSESATEEKQDACEICQAAQPHWPRYPHRLCDRCADQATDRQGRAIKFVNENFGGGILALYKDNDQPAPKDPAAPGWIVDCWVHGVACHASEARFGGVVVSRKKSSN